MYKKSVRRNMKKGSTTAAVALASLVLAACSSSSDSDGGSSGDEADTASVAMTAEQVAWAADYVHGKAGTKADSSLDPVTIGYLNQQGGTFDFVEGEETADAMVKLINEQLGGIDGHPVKLEKCFIAVPEDAQKCGTAIANNDDITSIAVGGVFVNNGVLYKSLGGKQVIFSNNLVFPEDFTTPNLFALAPNGVSQGLGAAAFAKQLGIKRVAIIRTDNPAGVGGSLNYKNSLDALGIKWVDVPVPEPGTAPEYAAAVRNAGVSDDDALLPVMTSIGCANVVDALKAQNLKPTVLASEGCSTAPMPERLKAAGQKNTDFPEGWHLMHWGYSAFEPTPGKSGGFDVLDAVLNQYSPKTTSHGYSQSSFLNMLAAARFTQEAGVDGTVDAIAAKVMAFEGPAALTPGAVKCGAIPEMPNACVAATGLSQFKDEKWVAIADGNTGEVVDQIKQQ
jgi:branched-chain amino acid transport system substrate-binding protein